MNTKTTSRLLRVFGAFAVCATAALGGQMQVEEAPEPGAGGLTTLVVMGTSFSFSAVGDIPPCSVGMTDVTKCQFLNESGVDWDILELSIAPGMEPVGCAALFGYTTCNAQQGTAVLPSLLTFSGGTGIRQGQILHFSGSGWTTTTTFDVVASAVPEPGTVVLILSGIAAIGIARRRRSRPAVN